MVSELDSGSSGSGSSPARGHCVVFLGKTLNSYSTSLYRHRDKLRPDGPLRFVCRLYLYLLNRGIGEGGSRGGT